MIWKLENKSLICICIVFLLGQRELREVGTGTLQFCEFRNTMYRNRNTVQQKAYWTTPLSKPAPPPSTVFAPARTWLMNIAVGGCGVVCVCLFCTVTQLHLIAKSISLKSIFASPENKNNLINKDAIYKSSQTHSCTYRVGF